MDKQEGAEVIESIIKSLKSNPQQFQINVNVKTIGVTGKAKGGGAGAIGIAYGGGTGISASASADGVSIETAQNKGNDAMTKEINSLILTLSDIANQLRQDNPDRSKLRRLYESLRETWVPGVIVSVVGNVLTLIGVAVTTKS